MNQIIVQLAASMGSTFILKLPEGCKSKGIKSILFWWNSTFTKLCAGCGKLRLLTFEIAHSTLFFFFFFETSLLSHTDTNIPLNTTSRYTPYSLIIAASCTFCVCWNDCPTFENATSTLVLFVKSIWNSVVEASPPTACTRLIELGAASLWALQHSLFWSTELSVPDFSVTFSYLGVNLADSLNAVTLCTPLLNYIPPSQTQCFTVLWHKQAFYKHRFPHECILGYIQPPTQERCRSRRLLIFIYIYTLYIFQIFDAYINLYLRLPHTNIMRKIYIF